MKFVKMLLLWLTQRSTILGILGLLSAAGLIFTPEQTEVIITFVLATVSLVLVFIKDEQMVVFFSESDKENKK